MMYLRHVSIRNIGPITNLDVEFELQSNSNPKPVILLGKNGSGKTYSLSYIADSFHELAKRNFNDVLKRRVEYFPYFKLISNLDINTGASSQSASAYLVFRNQITNEQVHYCEKIGSIDATQELISLYGNKISDFTSTDNSEKKTYASEESVISLFDNVMTFFPSFRHAIPHWLNLDAQFEESFNNRDIYGGELGKEIMCTDTFQKNFQWMLDVILDASVLPPELYDLNQSDEALYLRRKSLLSISYRNINQIFRKILENENISLRAG